MARSPWVLLAATVLVLLGSTACCRAGTSDYRPRSNVTATVFWVGEPASPDNDHIANRSSAWVRDWQGSFGGVDDPRARTPDGKWPAAFRPRENPFYFALPYGEFTDAGTVRADVIRVPWYDPADPPQHGRSILKNRWIEVRSGDRTAYAQWEDVGPFQTDDADYVFGHARPKEPRAGLDLSPATAAALGLDGRGEVSWRFVEEGEVPAGPWTEIVTRTGGAGQR